MGGLFEGLVFVVPCVVLLLWTNRRQIEMRLWWFIRKHKKPYVRNNGGAY